MAILHQTELNFELKQQKLLPGTWQTFRFKI